MSRRSSSTQWASWSCSAAESARRNRVVAKGGSDALRRGSVPREDDGSHGKHNNGTIHIALRRRYFKSTLLENARNDSRAMAGQNSDRSLKDSHNTRLFLLNDRR